MKVRTRISEHKYLLLMPSFYGSITWIVAYLLFEMRYIPWYEPSIYARVIFVSTGIFFILSTVVFSKSYKNVISISGLYCLKRDVSLSLLFHTIGFVGIAKYGFDIVQHFGGIDRAILIFSSVGESYQVRRSASEFVSIGIQATYFGWIASGMSVVLYVYNKVGKFHILLVFLQLFGNLIFVDRTRPIWIIFTVSYCMIFVYKNFNRRSAVKMLVLGSGVFVGLFLLQGIWSGKGASYSSIKGAFDGVYLYATSGFAYCSYIFENEHMFPYLPERVLYFPFKVLSAIGLADAPPSQVNDFVLVPLPTNVGTALEAFYRDGGTVFVVFGMAMLSFGANAVGKILISSNTPIGIFMAANVSFVSMISFFTPKMGSTAVWMIFAVFLVDYGMRPRLAAVRRARLERVLLKGVH